MDSTLTDLRRVLRRVLTGLWFAVCLLLLVTILTVDCTAGERLIRVLIFSGQNNHNWKATTPELERILTDTGRFKVDVIDYPARCTAGFLSNYDVILSNWKTYGANVTIDEWRPQMREAFLDFLRKGGGFVSIHAACASFPDWPEYQKIVGGTWGTKTGHGLQHMFGVEYPIPDHPIMNGLSPFLTTDELWHGMDLQPNATVVAVGFSAKDTGGSGCYEPVAMVTQYGKGRGFNLVLGNDLEGMLSAGFQALLIRGTEWASMGR